MDQLVLNSDMLKNFVSKIISKMIKKKLGITTDVTIDNIKIIFNPDSNKFNLRLSLCAEMNATETMAAVKEKLL